MLLFVTSRYPTEKHPKLPELLPFFRELLPPGSEIIGARKGRIFEGLILSKNRWSGEILTERRLFPRGTRIL